MQFPNQTPRQYTREDIAQITPGQYGVYGIFRTDQWIYVGKGDIRERMMAHVTGNDDNPCINRNRPTHWVSWVTDNADSTEKSLIIGLSPCCNRRVG